MVRHDYDSFVRLEFAISAGAVAIRACLCRGLNPKPVFQAASLKVADPECDDADAPSPFHYDAMAMTREGTTREQCAAMLQNPLTERLHLTVHRRAEKISVEQSDSAAILNQVEADWANRPQISNLPHKHPLPLQDFY